MRAAGWITLLYAIVIFLGGIMGFVKASSMTSLVTGGLSGLFLILCAVGIFRDQLLPTYFAVLLVLLLDGFFTYRWLLSWKFFPSGLMSILSLIALVSIVLLVRDHLRK